VDRGLGVGGLCQDFEVIEIFNDSFPYPALLGIDWAFKNSNVVDLNKRRMKFEGDGLRVIASLDLDEGLQYIEPFREEDYTYELENIYKLIARQQDYIKPTVDGNLSWKSDNVCSSNLEEAVENWKTRCMKCPQGDVLD
jgi:hypothetical protein